jgi:hypothetical protein
VPLQDWEDVRLWGRSVCVVFDSDVTTNPKVQTALEGLVGFLRGRGAHVGIAYLPDAPDGAKQSVDDFLALGKEIRDLEPFMHQGLREDLLPAGKPLSEIEPERIEWLWPRRIPKGKITVLDEDPDNGKSVLTTDLAARMTAQEILPRPVEHSHPPATPRARTDEPRPLPTKVARRPAQGHGLPYLFPFSAWTASVPVGQYHSLRFLVP